MGINIKIEGAEEIVAFFSEIKNRFSPEVVGDIAQKGAMVIKNEARRQMPLDGELGQVSKKAVVIKRVGGNKTIRRVTISNNLVTLDGKQVSIGKIIRHMTAGPQKERYRKGRASTGKVANRGGDFIEKAGETKGKEAVKKMEDEAMMIIEKRARASRIKI